MQIKGLVFGVNAERNRTDESRKAEKPVRRVKE